MKKSNWIAENISQQLDAILFILAAFTGFIQNELKQRCKACLEETLQVFSAAIKTASAKAVPAELKSNRIDSKGHSQSFSVLVARIFSNPFTAGIYYYRVFLSGRKTVAGSFPSLGCFFLIQKPFGVVLSSRNKPYSNIIRLTMRVKMNHLSSIKDIFSKALNRLSSLCATSCSRACANVGAGFSRFPGVLLFFTALFFLAGMPEAMASLSTPFTSKLNDLSGQLILIGKSIVGVSVLAGVLLSLGGHPQWKMIITGVCVGAALIAFPTIQAWILQ